MLKEVNGYYQVDQRIYQKTTDPFKADVAVSLNEAIKGVF